MDNCSILGQGMADMKKIYNNLHMIENALLTFVTFT